MSEQVREMFSSIATRYDVTNVVLSFGVDRRWREVAVKTARTGPGMRVLDCATGTGDLALAFRRTGASSQTDPRAVLLRTMPCVFDGC